VHSHLASSRRQARGRAGARRAARQQMNCVRLSTYRSHTAVFFTGARKRPTYMKRPIPLVEEGGVRHRDKKLGTGIETHLGLWVGLPILPSSEGGSVERVGRTYGRPLRTSEGQASKRFKGIRGSRGSGSGLGCLGSFACHQVSKYEVSRLPLACAVRLPHGHFMFMYIAVLLLSCSSCFTTLLLVHAAKEQRRQTADGTSRPDPRPT
jgi:hypothetical protein